MSTFTSFNFPSKTTIPSVCYCLFDARSSVWNDDMCDANFKSGCLLSDGSQSGVRRGGAKRKGVLWSTSKYLCHVHVSRRISVRKCLVLAKMYTCFYLIRNFFCGATYLNSPPTTFEWLISSVLRKQICRVTIFIICIKNCLPTTFFIFQS